MLACNFLRLSCCFLAYSLALTNWLAAQTATEDESLTAIRMQMMTRQYAAATTSLQNAEKMQGKNAAFDAHIARLQALRTCLATFWKGVDQGAVAALNKGELQVDDKLISIVEFEAGRFVIRHEGENKRYTLETLPPKLAIVLCQQALPPTKADNKVFYGAFLAMDAKGDRQLACQYWDEAARAGSDIKLLLPELAVELPPPPVEIPPLAPNLRGALNPAHWLVRQAEGEKFTREPLGKLGKNNAEGRLLVTASAADQQVLSKNRIAADFQSRVYLRNVGKGQKFGLYPSGTMEEAVEIALPSGIVKVEFLRKKGVFYAKVNDREVEVKPAAKSAEKMSGYLGISLLAETELEIASFEFVAR